MRRRIEQEREFFEPEQFYPPEYVVAHTLVPEVPSQIPRIIGLVGPARSGTTAFGILMAGHPDIDRSYFQAHKNGLRHGKDIILRREDKTIFMKDTLGPLFPNELFDPIEMLLQARVPSENITWIFTLRDPMRTFASLTRFTDRMSPTFFARMQTYTIELYEHYRRSSIDVVPFVYELYEGHEELVVGRLLERVGLGWRENFSLEFDEEAINKKMVWGEAKDPIYWEEVIVPILSRGRFQYAPAPSRPAQLAPELERRIGEQCQPGYERFKLLAMAELGLGE